MFGIGLFELALTATVAIYVGYNMYMLWKGSEGDIEYGEDQ